MRLFKWVLACACLAGPVSAETLYGVTTIGKDANEAASFLTVVETANATTTSRQIGDMYDSMEGIADDRNGSLKVLYYNYVLGSHFIGTLDAKRASIYNTITLKSNRSISGLAISKSGKTFSTFARTPYQSQTKTNLVTINQKTGRTKVGPKLYSEWSDTMRVRDLTFSGNTLLASADGGIFKVNRKTGELTEEVVPFFYELGAIAGSKDAVFGVTTAGALFEYSSAGGLNGMTVPVKFASLLETKRKSFSHGAIANVSLPPAKSRCAR